MSLSRNLTAAVARAALCARRMACIYGLGGPVGLYYAARLAGIKRRQARVVAYIDREKETNREHLRALNQELTQLVQQQQSTSQAAAQFWLACERKAGVQP